jgi:uncharacterized protein
MEYLFVTWHDYQVLAQKLAACIFSHSPIHDEIVSISRGGLTFGHIMSDLLHLPVYSFTIQSYADIQKQGEMTITQELGKPINGKRILLIDDVSDTGHTFIRAKKYLEDLKPASITTLSMYIKPKTIFRPDFFTEQTNKWIIFPYEVAETIKYFIQKMESDGQTKAQIQDFLVSLGFKINQIAFVRKHHMN